MAKERDAEKHLRRERAQRAALDFTEAAAVAQAHGMTLRRIEDYSYELSGTVMAPVAALSLEPISTSSMVQAWQVMLYPTTFRWFRTRESARLGPDMHYLRPGWRLLDAVQLATEKGQQEARENEKKRWTERGQVAEQEFPIAHDLAEDAGMVLAGIPSHKGPHYTLGGCPPSCWVAMPERRWELALWPHSCEVHWASNDHRFRATQGMQVLNAIKLHEEWTLMLAVEVARQVVMAGRMEVAGR